MILGCAFTGNAAENGGAIWNTGGIIVLDDSEFRDNVADQAGAISTVGGKVLLTQCGFCRNGATPSNPGVTKQGGALYSDGSADMSLVNCSFQGNTSLVHAGAVFARSGTLTIKHCRFSSNNTGNLGGAILIDRGVSTSISGSVFVANRAWAGGAVHCGTDNLVCDRCIFAGNQSQQYGGAVFFGPSGMLVLNQCTTQGNRAGQGSTIWTRGSSVQVKGSILWDLNALRLLDPIELSVAFSDMYEVHSGRGNISVDPLFARAGYWDPSGTPDDPNDDFWVEGDYHLKSRSGRWDPLSKSWVKDDVTSPCIDAGDPNTPVGDEPFPNGERINMGAYGGTIEASKSF